MHIPWWSHQMETYSALLAICAGNSPDPGEFPTQRPVTRSFDVYFDQRPNERLGKQSWGWWFETPSRQFWCHRDRMRMYNVTITSDCLWKISLCRGGWRHFTNSCRPFVAWQKLSRGINQQGDINTLSETYWPPFCRRHLPKHFLEWKCLIFN